GAGGVAALMGIPLVGAAYLLELGRRHKAPLNLERLLAALIGGFIGWGMDVVFNLSLIRLVVPREPPEDFAHALVTAVVIGALSGAITALMGIAIYRGKKWKASPVLKLVLGGLALGVTALVLAIVADPSAASGPGGGAILWAERDLAPPSALLLVAVLPAVATSAAAAGGGGGGGLLPVLRARGPARPPVRPRFRP